MNNKDYSLWDYLFSEEKEYSSDSKEKIMEEAKKYAEEMEKLFGEGKVHYSIKIGRKSQDENGKTIYHASYRFIYHVNWRSDLRKKADEIKQKENRNLTLEEVIEVIKLRNSDPENGFDR